MPLTLSGGSVVVRAGLAVLGGVHVGAEAGLDAVTLEKKG